MKKIKIMFVALMLTVCLGSITNTNLINATPNGDEVIYFPDPALQEALNDRYFNRAADHDITKDDMLNLPTWSISLAGYGVTNLEGIQYGENILLLYANDSDLSEVTLDPVKEMTWLRYFYCVRCNLQEGQLVDVFTPTTHPYMVDIDVSSNFLGNIDYENFIDTEMFYHINAYNLNGTPGGVKFHYNAIKDVSPNDQSRPQTNVPVGKQREYLDTIYVDTPVFDSSSYDASLLPDDIIYHDGSTMTPTIAAPVTLVEDVLTEVPIAYYVVGGVVNSSTYNNWGFNYTVYQKVIYTTNKAPTIDFEDFRATNEDTPLDDQQLLALFNVSANDVEDGDLTNSVIVDQSQVDYYVPGNYQVSFSVTDSKGRPTTIVGQLEVIDVLPSIELERDFIELNIGDITPELIRAFGAIAKEHIHGDIDDYINFSIEHVEDSQLNSIDTSDVNEYVITFTVTDNEGNMASAKASVEVTGGEVLPQTGSENILYILILISMLLFITKYINTKRR